MTKRISSIREVESERTKEKKKWMSVEEPKKYELDFFPHLLQVYDALFSFGANSFLLE